MAGAIIWSIIVFGCAFLFLGIGIYASRREKPMWFYSGTTVDASKISDVKAYNRENARMWVLYSLWYFASGAVYFWKAWMAVALLVLACTLGMGILAVTYHKIEKKYKVK